MRSTSLTDATAKKILEESVHVNRATNASMEVFFRADQRLKPKSKTSRQYSQENPTFKRNPKGDVQQASSVS